MRIAQVMAGARTGGAELFFERLTCGLSAAGEDVLAVIRRDADRADRLRAGGVPPLELGFGGPLDLMTRWRLGRALRAFQPRVVIAWMNRAAAATPRGDWRGDWVLVGRQGGFYDLKYYRHCDHIVGNTMGIVAWLTSQGWPAKRAHYVPNFVPDMAPGVVAGDVSLADRPPMLLALGRLHRNKAFDTLIRALPAVPGAHLSIAGEGPEREGLTALARDLGVADRVHLLGWRHDTAALLAECDVLVCPSRHEPLGNVVIEGWSARRPVVAAASQGPSELITHGETGLLVAVDDSDALASAIRTALEPAARSSLAAAGRLRYETDFAETAVVERWRQFLRGVEKT